MNPAGFIENCPQGAQWLLGDATKVEGKKLDRIENKILKELKFYSEDNPEEKIIYPLAKWLSNTISNGMEATEKEVYFKDTSTLKIIVNRIKERN